MYLYLSGTVTIPGISKGLSRIFYFYKNYFKITYIGRF